jgi:hypothetical protein
MGLQNTGELLLRLKPGGRSKVLVFAICVAAVDVVYAQAPMAGRDSASVPSSSLIIPSHAFEAHGPSPKLSAGCEGKISMVVGPSWTTGAQGVLSSSTYKPLSTHCKFEAFRRQTYSPFTFVSATWEATWAQAWAQWPQYGGGMEGWSKRLGATLADTESRRFIQGFLLSSLFHQDPRYFPSGHKTILARAIYAATRVIETRTDDGHTTLNTSELLGALFTSSLQNAYYPRPDRAFSNTMNRYEGALSSDAISDLTHEFVPDMKRLFHRHAPKEVIKIENKLPLPADDKL